MHHGAKENGSEIRVLHVDPESQSQLYTKLFLEKAQPSLTIEATKDPDEAARIHDQYDCILTEYRVNGTDGVQLIAALRETSDTPVIMYTGYGSEQVAEAAINAGASGYLRKKHDPDHVQALAQLIIKAVQKQREHRMLQRYAYNNFSGKADARTPDQQVDLIYGSNQLPSMVRHDLMGPLQAIKNAAFIIEKNPEYTQGMIEEVKKSVQFATEILEETRTQRRDLNLQKTDLNSLIRELSSAHSHIEGVEVHVELGEVPPIQIDQVKVKRVLDNLLRNAAEAMPRGGTITIATANDRNMAEVTVTDTGEGVPPGIIQDLFKPSFTTKKTGQGLGLAYSKQVAEAHGGTLTVESTPGKGARFTLMLPL